ncbi:hypothetical protein KDX30_03770 [Pseudomonas sp. CDFA 553]|uniref:hypothetical protein n=1 Tax=Pseudomonas quasicaspiana TaxID=2829821 RepID=UPI001E6403A6|nr:hypothetical protein [Pseudomonas quasicaspiana]MCD5987016.1 hypothetical protein [Pseudomonas quasicaspiana]
MIFVVVAYMSFMFLVFRNKKILAPSNVVFANYFLNFIFPATLFYILEFLSWDYVLPWGKLNDWATLSHEVILSYAYVFSLFFFITRGMESLFDRSRQTDEVFTYQARPLSLFISALLLLAGALYFFHLTGGLSAWLGDYSETFISKRKGFGLLNFLLIMGANFLAFWIGFYCKTTPRLSWLLLVFVCVVLAFCAYLQGVKSRVFYFAIFFSLPWIVSMRLTLWKGAVIFAAFLILFAGAMYVRSNGFYNTPGMLLEYFLTYFNTIFLHDIVLRDMQPGFFLTVAYPFDKWLTFFGVFSEDYLHDISRWLTAIYFPAQWFEESATQQWPIDTELYLNYGAYVFWIFPIALYSFYICALYTLRLRAGPIVLFIFVSELLLFLSMFRGSMLQWIALFNFVFYGALLLGQRFMFVRVVPTAVDRPR